MFKMSFLWLCIFIVNLPLQAVYAQEYTQNSSGGEQSTNDEEYLYSTSYKQYLTRNYIDALKTVQELIKLYPNYSEAYVLIGSIFLKLDKDEQALEAYNRAIPLLINEGNEDKAKEVHDAADELASVIEYNRKVEKYNREVEAEHRSYCSRLFVEYMASNLNRNLSFSEKFQIANNYASQCN